MARMTEDGFGLAAIHDEDDALALMYFGAKGMTRDADEYLATLGLARAHHRILFVIARRKRLTVGDLIATLGVTKQALHRPMKQLLDAGYVTWKRDAAERRSKLLRLTAKGRTIEDEASGRERAVMKRAFRKVGKEGRAAWITVMATVAEDA
jgi:DNA-binding MarR family transcriptional regulator